MSASRSDPPDGMSSVRQGARRRRSHPAPSSGLGSSRDRAHRRRISAASTCLLVRMQHLRRTPPRRAHRPSRPAAHRLRRSLDGVLSSVEAASGAVHEHGSQSTREPRVVGLFAKPRRRSGQARLRRTGSTTSRRSRSAHRRIADEGGPGQSMGLGLRRRELHVLRLPHQPRGRRSPGAVDRRFRRRHPLRSRPHVLELRPTTAMVLGSSQTRLQALIDSPCRTNKRLGHDLMRPTKELFALWKRVRDGTLSFATFQNRMKPIRREIDARSCCAATATRRHTASVKNWSNTRTTCGPSRTSKESSRRTTLRRERCVTLSSGVSCRSARNRLAEVGSSNVC